MKIAIIGGGVSGLVAGYRLQRHHDITLFEANDYIGGHTNTVDVSIDSRDYAIDTGFIVFNDRTYPNFIRLLTELNVESQPTRMSFSVSCQRTGLEYRGADFAACLPNDEICSIRNSIVCCGISCDSIDWATAAGI